jgi:hypothetical protein
MSTGKACTHSGECSLALAWGRTITHRNASSATSVTGTPQQVPPYLLLFLSRCYSGTHLSWSLLILSSEGSLGWLLGVRLPGLFHPREFVIAILQRHARIKQLPLEQVANSYSTNLQAVFSEEGFTHVQQHSVASCTATHFQSMDVLDGVVIGGLNLMGCYFDESTDSLRAQDGLNDIGQDTSPAPLVYMRPRAASKVRNRGVTVPVYQVPNYVPAAQYLTSNYIFSIPLPVTSAPNDWILRGVSLVCNCEQA